MKEGQPINNEGLTIKEIKRFFKESEKVTYGEILVSVFQDFTVSKDWELSGNNSMIGKIEDKENSPVMVLTNCQSLGGEKGVRLEVFRKRTFANIYKGDLTYLTMPNEGFGYNFKSETWQFSDKFADTLLKVAVEVGSRYSERCGAGDGGGSGHH